LEALYFIYAIYSGEPESFMLMSAKSEEISERICDGTSVPCDGDDMSTEGDDISTDGDAVELRLVDAPSASSSFTWISLAVSLAVSLVVSKVLSAGTSNGVPVAVSPEVSSEGSVVVASGIVWSNTCHDRYLAS